MATDMTENPGASLSKLLETIQTSLAGAVASLPASDTPHDGGEPDQASIVPPSDGISLLDTKSEILLSYLQNIVFLILLQVRQLSASAQDSKANGAGEDVAQIKDEVTKKLVELRVYLDRGVRPLEGRLKYQIDKVLKAAEDSQRSQQQPRKHKPNGKASKKADVENASDDDDDSGSEQSGSGSGSEEEEEEEDQEVDELAYRPNLAAFSRATQEAAKQKPSAAKDKSREDGIYRPPKIKPTAPPSSDPDRRADRESRRTPKSRIINEFVQDEMSGAPMAEASIGSTIRHGGRVVRTQRDREEDAERRAYEEANFTRLPQESKKERKKKGKRPERSTGFGGEEWQGVGEGADRIERLTRRAKRGTGPSALERSRKRRATDDGPRGGGVNVGEGFEKRRKKIAGWK